MLYKKWWNESAKEMKASKSHCLNVYGVYKGTFTKSILNACTSNMYQATFTIWTKSNYPAHMHKTHHIYQPQLHAIKIICHKTQGVYRGSIALVFCAWDHVSYRTLQSFTFVIKKGKVLELTAKTWRSLPCCQLNTQENPLIVKPSAWVDIG